MEFRRSAFSIHKEDTSIHREDVSSPQEDHQDQEPGKDTTEDDKMPTLDQKAGNGKATGWNPKKKRGPGRGTVTLGGLRKIEKAKKRKAKRKLRKKLGMNNVQMRKEMPRKLRKKGQIPPTRSVIFVDNSVGGKLAKRFQEAEEEAGDTTGYRVRITESAGSPLSMLLPSTNPWGPQDCLRKECVTCAQDDNKRIDCKKRNILYESECVICGEERKRMEKSKDWKDTGRGVYVGESSRSIFERAKEHVAGRNSLDEDNHQIKHWISSHEDLLAPPKFKFKIVKTFQDPLTRQLAEAVRIELRGEDILNSKSEFSRCRVPRLRIDMEGWQKKTGDKDERKRKDEQSIQLEEDHHHLIEEERLRGEAEDSLMEKDLKRKADNKESKRKRRKVERIEGWGQSTSQGEDYHHQEEEMAHSRDWMAEVNLNSQLINTKPMIQVNLV